MPPPSRPRRSVAATPIRRQGPGQGIEAVVVHRKISSHVIPCRVLQRGPDAVRNRACSIGRWRREAHGYFSPFPGQRRAGAHRGDGPQLQYPRSRPGRAPGILGKTRTAPAADATEADHSRVTAAANVCRGSPDGGRPCRSGPAATIAGPLLVLPSPNSRPAGGNRHPASVPRGSVPRARTSRCGPMLTSEETGQTTAKRVIPRWDDPRCRDVNA